MRIAPSGRITLTLPATASHESMARLLRDAAPWMEKRLAPLAQALADPIPKAIHLPALGRRWAVQRRRGVTRAPRTTDPVLKVSEDDVTAMTALRTWLKAQAKGWLPGRVATLAERHGFTFGRVTVRHQRGRWGSCSARGDISLNCLALLLPPDAVDHLILHELCHTRVMDHSRRFWETLAGCQANWQHWDRYLSRAMGELPLWALPP